MAPKKARGQILRIALTGCLTLAIALAQPPRFVRSSIQVARNFNRTPLPLAINSVAAAADNFLWIASDEGLFRFDGAHFHQASKEPASSVAVTTDGWVWTGSDRGLIAFRSGESRKMFSQSISSVVARGNEVLVNANGIWRGSIGGLSPAGVEANGPLALDAKDRAWFGCGREICTLNSSGVEERRGLDQGVPAEKWLGAIADDSGTIWAWHRRKMISIKDQHVTVWASASQNPATDRRMEAFRSRSGRIWMDGLTWIENGTYFIGQPAAGGDLRQSFTEDRFGNVWMGSLETGLSLLSPKSWARVWRGEDFLAGSESITQTQSGRLLAAKPAGGLSEYDSKEEQWKKLPGQFGAGHAWNSIEESNGDVWTIIQDVGIFRLNSKNQQTAVVFRGSMKDIDFRCLLRDRTGQIWVGAKRGLYRIDESGSPKLVQVALPGNSGYAGAFTTDASGQEWLGYDGGIARLEHGEWKLVIPQQALLSPRIRSLAVAPGPAFWVSYRAALPFSKVYRDSSGWKRQDFSPGDGYGPTETSSMLVDGHGWVWRGTDEGLFVSDGVHLAADDWLKFDKFNGLASDAVGTFGLTEDRDGVIWVSTDEGAARIQPDSNWFAPVSARSRPQVTALRWGGKQYLWPGPGEKLPAVPSPLEVDVSEWPEVSPRTPRIQFRLWPQEKEWKTAFDSTVRYNFLPPGNYRFDVRSVNSPATLSREFQIVRSGGFDWWWPLGGLVGSAGAGWWGWQRLREISPSQRILGSKAGVRWPWRQ